jgi:hypothetical protein
MAEYRVVLSKSDNPEKKYKVIVSDGDKKKTLHFGQAGASDMTQHGDIDRRERYLNRHRGMNEDWSEDGIFTKGWWSRYLLWQEDSIPKSKKFIKDKFNVKFVKKI